MELEESSYSVSALGVNDCTYVRCYSCFYIIIIDNSNRAPVSRINSMCSCASVLCAGEKRVEALADVSSP